MSRSADVPRSRRRRVWGKRPAVMTGLLALGVP
jgi:hypothetical protein